MNSTMNPRVFWGATLIVLLLLGGAFIAPGASDLIFRHAQAWVIDRFGWFYVASVAGFLAMMVILAIGPAGQITGDLLEQLERWRLS
jgi:choline/glycine/proline betaine transport protein